MKPRLRRPSILSGVLIFGVIAAIAGLVFETPGSWTPPQLLNGVWEGFGGNLWAEISGISIGAWVVFQLIERVLSELSARRGFRP